MLDAKLESRRRRGRIFDKLHRGFVNTSLIVSGIAGICLAYKIYEYFRYIRPLRSTQQKLKAEELLMEGKSLEES